MLTKLAVAKSFGEQASDVMRNGHFERLLQELESTSDRGTADWRIEVNGLMVRASLAGAKVVAVDAALVLVAHHCSLCELDEAKKKCARAKHEAIGLRDPVVDARLALAEERLSLLPANKKNLKDAIPPLESSGRWEEASEAAGLLARALVDGEEFDLARGYFSRAIGTAETSGAQLGSPNLLRMLAEMEIQAGRPEEAERLLQIALRRLRSVSLRAARLHEARCSECLGDAAAAAGHVADARYHYRDTMERLQALEAGGKKQILSKLDKLGTNEHQGDKRVGEQSASAQTSSPSSAKTQPTELTPSPVEKKPAAAQAVDPEAIWAELQDRYGPPRWEEDVDRSELALAIGKGRVLNVETSRDGYGGGDVSFSRAELSDLRDENAGEAKGSEVSLGSYRRRLVFCDPCSFDDALIRLLNANTWEKDSELHVKRLSLTKTPSPQLRKAIQNLIDVEATRRGGLYADPGRIVAGRGFLMIHANAAFLWLLDINGRVYSADQDRFGYPKEIETNPDRIREALEAGTRRYPELAEMTRDNDS